MVRFRTMRPFIVRWFIGCAFLVFIGALVFIFPMPIHSQQDKPKLKDVLGVSEEEKTSEQEEIQPESIESVEVIPPALSDDFNRGTPRTTVEAFLEAARSGDYLTAMHYLDLRNLPTVLSIQGEKLARQLRIVLDQALWIDYDLLSDHPKGNTDDGLPPNQEMLGRIDEDAVSFDIMLKRVRREDGEYIWKFSNTTVSKIPQLYKYYGYGSVGEFLSPFFPDRQFLQIRLWQWFAITVFGALSFLMAYLLTKLTVALVRLKRKELTDQLVRFFNRPVRILLFILIWRASSLFIDLSLAGHTLMSTRTILVFALVWAIVKLVDIIAANTSKRLQMRGQTASSSLLRPISNIAKVMIILIGLTIWLDNIGVKVATLVAGIGIGGAAIALAAQDSIRNFFGSVTILMDKPFFIGQRIVVSGHDGVVEEIGLRATRIRLLTGHRVSIPNQDMVKQDVENISERPHIRRLTNIRLALDTPPGKAEKAVKIIQRILKDHEGSNPDFPPRVYFNEFNDDSLNILVLYWYHPPNYWDFNALNQKVNLKIMKAFEKEGIQFAPPTIAIIRKGQKEDTFQSETESDSHPLK